MPRICRHVLVSGRVQGVGFRWHARAKAEELGLAGWIKNLPDGRVEAWIEGREAPLREWIAWVARGPVGARVTGVEVVERSSAGLERFEVQREP